MTNYIGEDFAKEHKYSPGSSALRNGVKISSTYSKRVIYPNKHVTDSEFLKINREVDWLKYKSVFITVFDNDTVEIHTVYKMVEIKCGPLSIPNSNFEKFEQDVIDCIPMWGSL